jgi:hypothetical protein
MTSKSCRKCTVLDAMILVAAVAIGFLWTRYFVHSDRGGELYPGQFDGGPPVDGPRFMIRIEIASWWVMGLSHCVAVIAIALLVLRLREPRIPLRQLARQPGTVACTAVFLAVMADFCSKLNYLAYWAVSDRSENPLSYIDFILTPKSGFLTVATSWLLLATNGRWQPEPHWIERAGIGLGVFWLVMPPLTLFVEIVGTVLRSWYP